MPKLIKTGYTATPTGTPREFAIPIDVAEKLGLDKDNNFLFKIISNGNAEYPFIIKYEHIERGVTDDVNSFEKCSLCDYATTNVACRLNGKPICADCADKLGGFKCKDKNKG